MRRWRRARRRVGNLQGIRFRLASALAIALAPIRLLSAVQSRAAYLAIIEQARLAGADSVILGCTEIGLLLDPSDLPLPGYDSTTIHADAAVRFALGETLHQAA